MCGIAGIAGPDARSHITTVKAMGVAQNHRGPDGTQTTSTTDGCAVMAMNILRIVDPAAPGGPYVDSASGLMLVLNGEIFNYQTLARRRNITVERKETDAHVLLRAWAQDGPHVLEEVDGMFALAVYDPLRATLFIARDRFGEKPIYWRADGARLAFASEVTSLTGYGSAPLVHRPEMTALETPVGPDTPFQGIQLLPPGSLLAFDVRSGSINQARWWDMGGVRPQNIDYIPAVESAVKLLTTAVAERAHSGPAALLLSGGLDSTLLAYLLRPEICVTVRYPGQDHLDESRIASWIARSIGANLLVVEPEPTDLCAELPRIVNALDYPIGNASLLSEHMAYRAVSEAGIRVVYGGLGPDELLMGYARHAMVLFGAEATLAAGMDAYRPLATKLMRVADRPLDLQATVSRLITRGPDPENRVSALVNSSFERAEGDVARALTLTELETAWRPLVTASDKLASAFGLERRSPYLAWRFAEFCYSLPQPFKIKRPNLGKRILRDAARELDLAEEVCASTEKRGFASPVPTWLSDPNVLSSWCEDQIYRALPNSPPALRPQLMAGLKRTGRFDRTRTQALLTAQWIEGTQRRAA